MGLEQRQSGNFITILDGKFSQRVEENTPGAVSRINKLGKQVWERYYDSFTGKLVGIKVKDNSTYGKSWVFSFKDKEDIYHLELSYSNSFATAFLKILPNVDVTKELKVSPSVKTEDGKRKSTLFVNQGSEALKHAYTRALPNGMPDMIEIMVKGVKTWDDTDRLVFLENMVMTTIVPKLEGIAVDNSGESVDEPIQVGTTPDTPIEEF